MTSNPNHNPPDNGSGSKRLISLGALLPLVLAIAFVVGAVVVNADSRRDVQRLERMNDLLRVQNIQLERANTTLSEQVRQYGGEPITDWGS